MKIKNKNIFLSCAYTNNSPLTIFDKNTRLNQLLKTIESCSNIEDHINIVSEGSLLSNEELETIRKYAIVLENPIDNAELNLNKSHGSLLLWIKALEQIDIDPKSDVYFLSGRYQLTDKFSTTDFQCGDFVFKKHWYSEFRGGWYGTQLFKVSGNSIPLFKNILEYSKKYIQYMDIECSLYRTFYDMRIMPSEIPMVNCIGWFGPNGNESIH